MYKGNFTENFALGYASSQNTAVYILKALQGVFVFPDLYLATEVQKRHFEGTIATTRPQPKVIYVLCSRATQSSRAPLGTNRFAQHIGEEKSMTLRTKTWLIFGIVLTGLIGVLYATSSTILLGSLKKAEQQDTRQIVKGVLGVLDQTQEDFSSRFSDWAAWDETYTFIEDANKHYLESGFTPEIFTAVKLNLAVWVHSSGRIVSGTGFNLKTKQKTSIPAAIRKHLFVNDLLLQHSNLKSNHTGIILLPEGPMLISSRPIVTTKGQGPIRGTLIVGRYLDAVEIQKLAKTTRSSLSLYSVNSAQMPAAFQAVRSSLLEKETIVVHPLSEQTIAGYALLKDIYNQPAVLLQVDIPRHIYRQGQSSLYYLVASLLVVGLIFAGVTLRLLERLLRFWQERQEREERYRAVVAQASEGIFLIDADSRHFLEANKAFENLLGYTSKEVLGLTLYDVVADNCDSIDHRLQHIQTKKCPSISEWQYCRKNGSLVDVEVSANPISYEEKDVLCIVVRDISERKRTEEVLRESEKRLSWQANHDALTQLFNRREFEQRLQQAVDSAKTTDQQHALCYLDLDQFKIVNDNCGHVAGDELLRQVSTLFQSGLRKTDLLARLGGDEFGVLLYNCPLPPAVHIANMLCERIRQFRFVWQDKTFALSVSIGLVVLDADTQSLVSVSSAADTACYAAKNKGRDRVHIYQLDDRELLTMRGEMQWVSRIPKALEENRFCLYYQRIVPVAATDQHEHREILLRLQDEDGKMVPPMAFIPAAERYNLMHLIDRWVISTLFAHVAQQSQTPNYAGIYAVNLSGASINDDNFIDFVQSQFALHCIPPSRICFEITETLAITNLAKAARFVVELKALGCHFALDDFGSGMSSFAYLKNLPVDYLKIDGAFIKDIVQDAIASSMVEAIARVASVMKIQTIAEFVENDAILTKLKLLGVDYAQGYGIAKPCPLN